MSAWIVDRGSWIVDRNPPRRSASLAHSSQPRTPKAVRPRVEISLAPTTDPFNPCFYPLNPYSPKSVERPERLFPPRRNTRIASPKQ